MAQITDVPDELRVPELTPGARRILEVSSDLFYRSGIHAVGVDTIAAESGITKRTLYDRFGSKDNLVATYLRARHQEWWSRLEERIAEASSRDLVAPSGVPAASGEPAAPRVLIVFDAYAHDRLASDRGCAFLNAAGELPVEHPGYEVVRAHKQAVRRRIEELIRADCPGVNEPERTADHLFLLLEGAIAHRGVDGDDHLLVTARKLATRILRGGGDVTAPRGP